MQTVQLHIPDMHCSNCVMRLEGLEDDLPGVIRVDGSYHKQTLRIAFDERQTSSEQIFAAIRKLGYTPELNS
ncbi:MAG: hypothetical protein OHK0052_22930 [Anaerolineales bacterium]